MGKSVSVVKQDLDGPGGNDGGQSALDRVERTGREIDAKLVGEGILHNPRASIGHRFRTDSPNYSIGDTAIPVNQLRLVRKNFGDRAWEEWLDRLRSRLSEEQWKAAWVRFLKRRRSAEKERTYILGERKRDEYWYAARFGLAWPVP